jgi:hypothetical protein
VPVVGKLPERAFDVVPAPLVFETTPNQFGDERTAPPRARSLVEFGDQIVVQSYVQTHVLNLAHESGIVRCRSAA